MTLSPIRWQSSILDAFRATAQPARAAPPPPPPARPATTTTPPPPLLPTPTRSPLPTTFTLTQYTAPTQNPKQVANEIYGEFSKGKSIDAIAEDRGMTRQEVIQALGGGSSPKVTVTPAESNNGDVRTTVIKDDQGRTITEHIDYHHGTHYTTVKDDEGKTTTSPIRNEAEEKQERTYDSETGVSTRTEVDDLDTGQKTVTTRYRNGTTVETTINTDGTTKTVVRGADGKPIELVPTQTAPGIPGVNGSKDAASRNTKSAEEQFAGGKSIEDIAESRGLSTEQVAAELEAAGYTVKQEETSVGRVVTVTDSKTGIKTTYTRDFDHGASNVTVANPDGTETSRSVDGNGRTSTSETNTRTGESTTKIVDPKSNTTTEIEVDKYGRRTVVTTEKGADGKEKVTTETTANGHTMTVGPDGKITLKNNDTDTTLKIEENSANEALARSLIDANPESGNAEEAKEGRVTVAFATSTLADEALPSLESEATAAGTATKEAIDAHGVTDPKAPDGPKLPGVPAVPGNTDGVTDPIGRQPKDSRIPPGETWVPINIDGKWTWVHPKVAEAIGNERIALAKVTETKALIGKSNADLNRYLLDPAYNQAVQDARAGINDGLAPFELQWNATKPEGTLADAIELQTAANSAYENAGEARNDYERAAELQTQAIEKRVKMPFYPDGTTPVATAADSNYNYDLEVKKGDAAWAEVNALFAEADAAYKSGDKNLTDMMVVSTGSDSPPPGTLGAKDQPVEIKIGDKTVKVAPEVAETYDKPGAGISALTASTKPIAVQVDVTHPDGTVTKEWRWVAPQLALLKIQSDGALELSEAYSTYYSEASRLADFEVEKEILSSEAIANQRELAPHQFDPEGFTDLNGDFSGKLQGFDVYDRNGQLVLEIQYEDKKIEIKVTADPSDRNAGDEARNGSLAERWRSLLAEHSTSGNQCVANPYVGAEQAKINVTQIIKGRVEANIAELDKQIQGLTAQSQTAINEHGLGSTEPPPGTLPPGQQPVEIQIENGPKIMVSPEVKEQYETQGLGALIASGKPVWIELTASGPDRCIANEGRWVDPSIATLQIQIAELNQDRQSLQDMKLALQGNIDHSNMLLSRPDLMGGRPDADWEYLQDNQQLALDGLAQPKMQSLLNRGYDQFKSPASGDELDDLVDEAIGFGPDNGEERGKVTDEIRNVGGDTPQVRIVPMFYVPEGGSMTQTALFAVKGEDGAIKYVDANGQTFDNLEDFQDNNRQFDESGKLIVPENLEMRAGADGKVALEVVQARNVSVMDKVVDPIVGVVGGIATVASFTPLAPVAAPIAVGSGLYLGGRAAYKQKEYLDHGGEWGDRESVMNLATIGTTALPVFGGGLRAAGMMRSGIPAAQATKANLGMMRMQNSTLSLGSRTWTFQASPYANAVSSYTRTAGGLNLAAHTLDGAAIAIGVPMVAASAGDLLANGGDMSWLERASAITGLTTGVIGTGMGVRGIATYRPSRQGSQDGAPTTADGSGQTVVSPDAIIVPGRGSDEPPAVLEFVNGQWQPSQKNYSGPSATSMHGDGAPMPVVKLTGDNGQPFEAPVVGPLPADGNSVYVPKPGEPSLPANDPALAGKSHVLVRAPGTGEALVLPLVVSGDGMVPLALQSGRQTAGAQPKELTAAPERRMLEASPATTYTYNQVQNLRGRPRYTGGEVFVGELNRGTGQHHYPVAANPSGPHPVNGTGGRFVDVHVIDTKSGRIYAIEVKTYVRYRTVDGQPVFNTVPLSKEIQQQINKDIALRNTVPGYEPQWVFLGAPPSPELQKALDDAGFIANIWHPPGKPPKGGVTPETATTPPQPTGEAAPPPSGGPAPMRFANAGASGNGNPRGPIIVDGNGVASRRVFNVDGTGEITVAHPSDGSTANPVAAPPASGAANSRLPAAARTTSAPPASSHPPGKTAGPRTREELESLSITDVEALTEPQIVQIPARELGLVSPGQFRKFTPDQFSLMSEQWHALSVPQLTAFRKTHARNMAPDQKALVDLILKSARAREMENAAELFGPMAGSSYVLWSSLPPQWMVGATGVAFAWRGVVFSAQALFPKATAPHTRLGRFLNGSSGLSFIASSPGSAMPFLQSLDNPAVNGSYTAGNSVFSVKGVLDSLNRRATLSFASDYIGNGAYLVGSAFYTVQNIHSPLAATAGALFTIGSAEFLVSAAKRNLGYRHGVPRTDEDIAAAAKSARKWAGWDRIALGVTFGGGLLIFAYDALDDLWATDQNASGETPGLGEEPSRPSGEEDGTDAAPPEPGEQEPAPDRQLIVDSDDGLNLRRAPDGSSEIIGVLRPDSFIQQTGQPKTDTSVSWLPVEGYTADGQRHSGWVAGAYVDPHPSGSSTSQGRINPELEQKGFEWVEVQAGQTFGGIAHHHKRDTAQTVSLNMGHIADPALIFEGDRIYLPVA